VYSVPGGGVAGGRVAGAQIKVNQANLFQNRDYPMLTDYRELLGRLFARAYGSGSQRTGADIAGHASARFAE
jgi:uncharacterized protein (DUF1501 family)